MTRFKKGFLMLMMTVLMLLAACSDASGSSNNAEGENNQEEDKGTIEIGQISWPENIAVTNMWKAILEDKGYDVKLTLVEMGPQMASLSEGDLDVAPEVWLPIQDKSYYEEYKDEADFAETPWYDNGKVGLAVPKYMEDINSIEDLNENKEKFNSEITGFEPGAGTMKVTSEVIDEYDLDYELIGSSEAAMISSVRKKVDEEQPIVAPLWTPHYIFSEVDLKFLDDPKGTYGETEEIYMATRDGFESEFEEVYNWMSNWKLSDDQLGDLMISVQNNEEGELAGAKEWVEDNQDIINEWQE